MSSPLMIHLAIDIADDTLEGPAPTDALDRENAKALAKTVKALAIELGKAQAAAKTLAHCYEKDARPPMATVEYGKSLPVRLPVCPGLEEE